MAYSFFPLALFQLPTCLCLNSTVYSTDVCRCVLTVLKDLYGLESKGEKYQKLGRSGKVRELFSKGFQKLYFLKGSNVGTKIDILHNFLCLSLFCLK